MKRSLTAGAVLVLLAVLSGGAAAQDADVLPPWSLKFTHGPLDVITVPYKDGSARSFNYFTFKLENNGRAEADLRIHIKAVVGSSPRKQKVHLAVPEKHAEEFVRRMSRTPGLKNVNEINGMGKLAPGQKVMGIAVLGTFHREWDVATVTVSGLEPRALHCRVRKIGDAGFTLAHRAYAHHNRRVKEKAGADAEYSEVHAIVRHDVVWVMKFHREGDEFSPHLDPIILDGEGWDVVESPGPEVVMEKKAPFSK